MRLRKAKRKVLIHKTESGKIKSVKRGRGRPKKDKSKLLDKLASGVDACYSRSYSFPHSTHEAISRSGLIELLRELGPQGVKVLREDSDRKALEISKLTDKIKERDKIINSYRCKEQYFKKAPKASKELGGLPEDTTDIELVMCLNLIKQFRVQPSKELFVNRLKFAIGIDPIDGLNSLLKSGVITD